MAFGFALASWLGHVPRSEQARKILGKQTERHIGLHPTMRQNPEMLALHEATLGAAVFGLHAFGNELARIDAQAMRATRGDVTTATASRSTSSCSSSSCGSCGGGCGGCS